ncbi:MAG: tRNA (adenosine(37)-N6)-dimethylallyltransferase MiaA [Chloroflexi bacterium]|nr:tRNA (adenosine(37)-N6)-dimethylallyltransferase MiaA [Chloroflexota bacterium]
MTTRDNAQTDQLIPLIVLIGPTAVGKTDLSLQLAQRFDGEIVSADSRLLYRGMDIGTAKPTPEERARVPHHLIDITTPDRPLSLAEYLQLAHQAIQDIHARGKRPFLVGGTGQYIWALLEGWQTPHVPPDQAFRARLEEEAREKGVHVLYERLRRLDPDAAQRMDPNNLRRIIRALEVIEHTGKPFSQQQRKIPPPYRPLIIGLTRPRDELYRRVDERIERMIQAGLVDEVRRLLDAGYDPALPALSGIGYRQIIDYLQGRLTLEEAKHAMRKATRRFVRHQYNWFRPDDPRILWVDLHRPDAEERVEQAIRAFLAEEG